MWFWQRIDRKLDRLIEQGDSLIMTLAELKIQVEKNTAVEESAVSLITGIAKSLADALANSDPAAVQAMSDELTKSAADLGAAVAANTPAA